MFPRVTRVKYLHDYVLELTFSDGTRGCVDWRQRLDQADPDGIFAPLRDPDYFAQVELWPEAGTIRWPNGADICPDVLHSAATGAPLPDFKQHGTAQADT
jgi:hypothetical protein